MEIEIETHNKQKLEKITLGQVTPPRPRPLACLELLCLHKTRILCHRTGPSFILASKQISHA